MNKRDRKRYGYVEGIDYFGKYGYSPRRCCDYIDRVEQGVPICANKWEIQGISLFPDTKLIYTIPYMYYTKHGIGKEHKPTFYLFGEKVSELEYFDY